jgi:hypothetical protein
VQVQRLGYKLNLKSSRDHHQPSPHDHVVLISKFLLGSFLFFPISSLFDCSIRLKIEHHGHTTYRYDLYSRTVPV